MSGVLYAIGFMLRDTGRALDRVGCRLQLHRYDAFHEKLWPHKSLQNLSTHKVPSVAEGAWIAESATLDGTVRVEKNANIWYGAVLRGDAADISVGKGSNVQDGAVIRSLRATPEGEDRGTTIGENVTIGHGAIIHGATIEDNAFIGIGSVLQAGVKVESGAMVAAGAVVQEGTTVPSGQVWGGSPAKYMRSLKPEESDFILPSAEKYVELAKQHRQAEPKSL